MVAGISSKDRRRITEGTTKEDFGGHKCPPTGRKRTRELSRQNRDTQWKGWRGGEKKEKAPQEKSPQQKKRNRCLRLRLLTGGCAALLSRFFSLFLRRLRRLLFLPSPRFSLLLWAAAPPLLFASPLALLSDGCAARPLLLLLSSSAAAPPHTPPRSRGRLAPPPRPPLLHYEIASLRDAHGDRCSSIPRLRKSEIFLSGVIEIEPLRGLFCCRHLS